jgi:HK97 family phage prohead protease
MTTAERRRLETGTKVGPQRRYLTCRSQGRGRGSLPRAAQVPGLNLEARTLELSFSSEAPVARWFGNEVLSHDSNSADLTRLNDAAPLLFNHNMDDVIGVVERAWIDGDRKGRAVVRFAKTARGDEILGMVADGILRNVSFMYQASKYRIESDEEDPYYDDDAIYTATRWEAFEISIVSVPADQTVGVGRSLTFEERSVEVETPKRAASPAAPPNLPNLPEKIP